MAPATPPAGIQIHCRIQQGRIAAVAIVPRRPYPVEKLLAGRTPAEALGLFANLFALCPEAHCNAAAAAMAEALGLELPPALRAWQERRRLLEIVKEHSFYLLRQQPPADPATAQTLLAACRRLAQAMGGAALYWPLGAAPAIDLAAARECLTTLEQSLAQLCGGFWRMPADDLEAVYRWQASQDSPAAQLLQRYAQAGWADFGCCASPLVRHAGMECRHPWPGMVHNAAPTCTFPGHGLRHSLPERRNSFESGNTTLPQPIQETGSYARMADTPLIRAAYSQHGNGLYSRALARLAELKALFQCLADLPDVAPTALPLPNRDSGNGQAQTEASRGRLFHRTALSGGRIADYHILAPTEWNFHPQGLLPQALLDAPADEALAARIEALLHAIDPCVDFQLRLEHA
jgi:Ni,Fe-hydrogenase I large subunit